jgi:hypothetical protein
METHRLGWHAGKRLECAFLFDGTGPGEFGMVTAKFIAWKGRQPVRVLTVELGQSIWKKTPNTVADFVALRRRQVFARVEMGGVGNWIFDFDGERIRRVYELAIGRVRASVIRSRARRWKIEERWPNMQWKVEDELGVGRLTADNTIRRTLHWDGRRFVPDHPGWSRIIRGRKKKRHV